MANLYAEILALFVDGEWRGAAEVAAQVNTSPSNARQKLLDLWVDGSLRRQRVSNAVQYALSLPEPARRAEANGHRVRSDPPAGMTGVERWTCLDCGAAVLRYGTNVYGSALTNHCAGPADQPS